MSHATTGPALSPYDTGDRCEAKPWLPYGTKVSEATPAENFGRVDFDDDCGDTTAVVYLERNADGTYTLHVEPMIEPDELAVELHLESGTKRLS